MGRNTKCRKCGTENPNPEEAGKPAEGCVWCEKGECWDHGQIDKPGKGGGKAKGGKGGGKPGDWNCPQCGDLVFASRSECRNCGPQQGGGGFGGKGFGGGGMKGGGGGMKGGGKPGDWECPNCGDNVFASKNACRQCGTEKPAGGGGRAMKGKGMKGGKGRASPF